MSAVQLDNAPAMAARKRDITSWAEVDISNLDAPAKRYYKKRKSAIRDYFTTDDSIETIGNRYRLSHRTVQKLAAACLKQHEDGEPWGFRALLPGVTVVDHADHSTGHDQSSPGDSREDEDTETEKRKAITFPPDSQPPVTPLPLIEDTSVEEETIAIDEAIPPEPVALISQPDAQEPPVHENEDEHAESEASLAERTSIPSRPALIDLPILSLRAPRHFSAKKIGQTRRSIRKRWMRDVQKHRKQGRMHRIVSGVVVAAVLFVILLPLATGVFAYSTYTNIRGVALDGVSHLLAVKSLLVLSKSDPSAALNTQKLQQAQGDFNRAESDFLQLQQMVNRPEVQSAIQQFAPQYGSQLVMAQRLVQVGLDVSRMGTEMIGVGLLGASILHGSPLGSASNKPLITVADISDAEGAMVHALYYINDIRTQMSQVSMKDLPISDAQKSQLTSVLSQLPRVQDLILQAQGLTGAVSWLLGVGQERRFLVQTMDSAELRPTGGFTGQYGILEISNGRVAPFTLRDVTELDYNGNGAELNRPAPPEYRSWMTFGYFGLRDANLSGDYPTSARLGMQVFQDEGGGPIDGDISFTPVLIEQVLDVVGPIQVPQYHETITAQNLEAKLHYYQQDRGAILLQQQKTGTNNAATRKAFTSLLGKLLLDRVRHLQVKQLMTIMQYALKDLQSRDLEIYFTNPLAEGWLAQHGYSGAMDTFSKHDGFMVVQSNISISKASQYVHTTEQDSITLDAQGGATHNLTITLDYKQTGPVYGYDTYADFIRVYAPANAQLIWGDGFDTGQPLCTPNAPPPGGKGGSGGTGGTGGGTGGTGGSGSGNGNGNSGNCAQFNTSFPSNARYCPNGDYSLGQNAYVPGKGFTNWPVDKLGPPTELTSDLPGRAMWGGLTVTPKNCSSYISLSWYVPNVVKHVAGQSPYALLVQKQGGYVPTIQISIDTSAIASLKPYSFDGDINADRLFALPVLKKK